MERSRQTLGFFWVLDGASLKKVCHVPLCALSDALNA